MKDHRTAPERAYNLDERMSLMADALSDGIVFVDREWRLTYVNPAAERMGTLPANQILGRSLWEVSPSLAGTECGIGYARAMDERVSITVREFRAGLGFWLEATAYPSPDGGLALLLRDVTETQGREQRIREQDRLLDSQAALLDKARDAVILRDLGGSILYWNEGATRIYGWGRDEVIGKQARDLLYSLPDQFQPAMSATLANGHWTGELRQVSRTGEDIIVESTWTLVRDNQGNPESVFSVNIDVTQQRHAEQLASRTQRMESLGTLASGIAHDLNNVLTPILMAVDFLVPGETAPSRRETLASIQGAVKRGADMIRQVLAFAKGASGRRDPMDIGSILGEVSGLAREWPDNLRLTVDAIPELWSTTGDDTQLLQVLLNLIGNARDAMPLGGNVIVRARNTTLADSYSSVSHLAMPGSYVVLEVEDEGTGIPADWLAKIFEPFYTTKRAGAGTGLGLSTSLAIVRGHGGYMQAYSEIGRGSVFRIYLPAEVHSDTQLPGATSESEAELPRGHGELILVVDDEAAIRQITRQILDAYGYKTAVASNGAEAIALMECDNGDVALVFTDTAMPVLDGIATAAYLDEHHPHIPVILASGLSAPASGDYDFIAKPYTTEQLLIAVAGALGSPAARMWAPRENIVAIEAG